MLTQLIFWLALIILPLSAPLILWGTSLPFSMYAMHIIFVFVCAGVYYTDRHLLVRRLLLKKHRLAFILANIALLALGTCLTFLSVRLLLKAPGVSQEQRNLLYSLPVNLIQGAYSFCAMVIAGVAAIAGTATEDLRVSLALNDMLLRERDEARKQKVDSITVKVDLMKRQIRCEDILYMESERDYVIIHMDSGEKLMTLARLKQMQSSLPEQQFCRIHRSYLVNMDKVTAVRQKRAYLGDVSLPVSDSCSQAFFENLSGRSLSVQS